LIEFFLQLIPQYPGMLLLQGGSRQAGSSVNQSVSRSIHPRQGIRGKGRIVIG
jgi:hypothetical protein